MINPATTMLGVSQPHLKPIPDHTTMNAPKQDREANPEDENVPILNPLPAGHTTLRPTGRAHEEDPETKHVIILSRPTGTAPQRLDIIESQATTIGHRATPSQVHIPADRIPTHILNLRYHLQTQSKKKKNQNTKSKLQACWESRRREMGTVITIRDRCQRLTPLLNENFFPRPELVLMVDQFIVFTRINKGDPDDYLSGLYFRSYTELGNGIGGGVKGGFDCFLRWECRGRS